MTSFNGLKLKGFIWRGDERIRSKDDIFDEDDNNIQLVKIRGIDQPLDIQEQDNLPEEEDSSRISNGSATLTEENTLPKEVKDPDE